MKDECGIVARGCETRRDRRNGERERDAAGERGRREKWLFSDR
jgi:hypothetical protein